MGLQGVTGGDKGLQRIIETFFLSRTSANTLSRSIFDKDKR